MAAMKGHADLVRILVKLHGYQVQCSSCFFYSMIMDDVMIDDIAASNLGLPDQPIDVKLSLT